MTFRTVDELYKAFSWKSASKFIPLAKSHGFTAAEARAFLKRNVEHDVVPKNPSFMHIYSKTGDEYQMDILINDKLKDSINYLILININTRKAYAYELTGKGASAVRDALDKFIQECPNVRTIVSDQDPAYLKESDDAPVLTFMKDHNIDYRTTEDNNHNILGIVNRFIRTIRDYFDENRKIYPDEMSKFIKTYNSTPHSSINFKAPNAMNAHDEADYIKTMSSVSPYKFNPGDTVKVVEERNPFIKHRRNVSKQAYTVDSRDGNQYIIKAKDDSIDKYPGYRLVKTNSTNIASSIKDGKRGIVEQIISYIPKSDKYNVVYQGGVTDSIKSKNLREGAPTVLSTMEREYWGQHLDEMPWKIKKWV